MEKKLHYKGEFLSRAGVAWRAEIWMDSDSDAVTPQWLTFEADEAVTIEYGETKKEDVLCGSTATLRIESPGDRTYVGLYTVKPDAIRLDIYRNGTLYWSGCLDPEFYEEPYERQSNYVVALTFSDFGILDRLKYDGTGLWTLRDIIGECLTRSGIHTGGTDISMITTTVDTSGVLDLLVDSANFYDEDGEAFTLKEVLEGILQPLGLRMVQRGGKVWIYDLNGLYTLGTGEEAVWNGDKSTLGVDAVYNNVKITWSPYVRDGELNTQEVWTEGLDEETLSKLNFSYLPTTDKNGTQYFGIYASVDNMERVAGAGSYATDPGFIIALNDKGKGATLGAYKDPEGNDTSPKFFRIIPGNSGDECEGVAIFWSGWKHNYIDLERRYYGRHISNFGLEKAKPGVLARFDPVGIPVLPPTGVSISVLFEFFIDPRVNPFEPAAKIWKGPDNKDMVDKAKKYKRLAIPVRIMFESFDGELKTCRTITPAEDPYWGDADNDNPAFAYLEYYDIKADSSGIGTGWMSADWFLGDPCYGKPGKMWVEVLDSGWEIDGNPIDNTNLGQVFNGYYDLISWILMKVPQIKIVQPKSYNPNDSDLDTDDIEYNAEINPEAKESLDIGTICGTKAGGVPGARGAYIRLLRYENGDVYKITQVETLTRAGRTAQAEELLAGTLYSQYGERRTTLSGEVELPSPPLRYFTEQNQGDRRFICTGETQDLITDTSDVKLVEFRPDEYDKRNG